MEKVKQSHILGAVASAALLHYWAFSLTSLAPLSADSSDQEVLFVELEMDSPLDPVGSTITNNPEPAPFNKTAAMEPQEPVPEDVPKIEEDVAQSLLERNDPKSLELMTQVTTMGNSVQEPLSGTVTSVPERDLLQRNQKEVEPAGPPSLPPSDTNVLGQTDLTPSETRTAEPTIQTEPHRSDDLLSMEPSVPVRNFEAVRPLQPSDPTISALVSAEEDNALDEGNDLVPENPEAISEQMAMLTGSDLETMEASSDGHLATGAPIRSTRRSIEEYSFVWAEAGQVEASESSIVAGNPEASVPVITTSEEGAWKKRCTDIEADNICEIIQEVFLRKNIDGEKRTIGRLLRLSVSFEAPGHMGGVPYFSIQLPLGVDLRPGVVIKVDAGLEIPLRYLRCTANGCRVGRVLDDELLLALHQGTKLFVGFRPWGGSLTNVIPASLEGFDQSFLLLTN